MTNKGIALSLIGSTVGGAAFWAGLIVYGCATANHPMPDPTQQISNVEQTAKTVGNDVGSRAKKIDVDTAGIVKVAPVKVAPAMGPFLSDIGVQTAGLRVDQGQLATVQGQLEEAQADVNELKKTDESLTQQVAKLEAEKRSALNHVLGLLIVLSVLGIGTSGALLYLGNPSVAIPLAVGCAGCLVMSLLLVQYAVWLAIGGGVLLLGGIVYLVVKYINQKKATVQVVQTTETTKQLMTPVVRAMAFGAGAAPGYAQTYQTPRTRKIVRQIRSSKTFLLAPPHDIVAQAQAAGVAAAHSFVASASAK